MNIDAKFFVDQGDKPLTRADVEKIQLASSSSEQLNLAYRNLRGIDLNAFNLKGANLETADLRKAILQGAQLQGANLLRSQPPQGDKKK